MTAASTPSTEDPATAASARAMALVQSIAAADAADRDGLVAQLRDVEQLLSWCQARKLSLVGAIASVSSVAERDIAEASRINMNAADRMIQRARQLADVPAINEALAWGSITAGHADALADSLRAQEPAVARLMRERSDALVAQACTHSVDQFRQHLARTSRDIRRVLGICRAARQRRDTSLRWWTDMETGMFHLAGQIDPQLAFEMAARLEAALAQIYAMPTPENCPTDPIEKQNHLRALALDALITGRLPDGSTLTSQTGGVDVSVVVDATKDDIEIDFGMPLEVPVPFLIELLTRPRTKIHPIVVRNGALAFAPGNLHQGRDARLANRAQRRALRAMYATCAIPGCSASVARCRIHHVRAWDDGGDTDIELLLPTCAKHHARIHAEGWQLELSADRTLRITLPDGTELPRAGPNRHWG
ncbi:MAG: HNH endonuclease signature motif containing protein [Acidimicrobiia bacterium]